MTNSSSFIVYFVAAFFLMLVFSVFIYIVILDKYLRLLKAFDSISKVTKAVRYGNFYKRINIESKGRVKKLSENVNNMIESLQDREKMIKEYQREIHEKKEYLEAIFNSLDDGLIIVSENCKILKVNPTVINWTGMKENKLIGKSFYDVFKCKCRTKSLNDDSLSECCSIGSPHKELSGQEVILCDSSNNKRYYAINSSKMTDMKGEPNFVITLRDITGFKEMDRMREDFIATLTHDLRVPIIAESNTLKLFLKEAFGELTHKQKEALTTMLQSNDDLITLVNSLLDTYKYESGTTEVVKEPVNIKKLIEDCAAGFESAVQKNSQTLKIFIDGDLSNINADNDEIKRVIKNLINNAILYTQKEGLIEINVKKQKNEILFSIQDNGRGIAKEDQGRIFDRFFSTAKKFRKVGTGLGLYLSKQIIEHHGGKIWFESEAGKGSTFYFTLPEGR
jgi:PAS domain S-box-containing protein